MEFHLKFTCSCWICLSEDPYNVKESRCSYCSFTLKQSFFPSDASRDAFTKKRCFWCRASLEDKICIRGDRNWDSPTWRDEGSKRRKIPRAQNHHWGRQLTPREPKRPNNVTSSFFKTVHLLPKNLRFENGDAKLASHPWLNLTLLRPCSLITKMSRETSLETQMNSTNSITIQVINFV